MCHGQNTKVKESLRLARKLCKVMRKESIYHDNQRVSFAQDTPEHFTLILDIMEDVGMEIQREVRGPVIKKDALSHGILPGANLRVCFD